ncbi:DJ-1/PfpI family protein [uncultured Endozoicomonas sp.]|uniref:DJ-1/PfpI family protein n=1 Tax=uncultured Endozoicomonas sp. TaxID=432652 RepID=UPI0026271693|nr:DJ-1/PfpI family protein [uncultured Endozoicomonas sp.]
MNIGIYIYKQAEVLDFSGPFEVFSTATRLSSSDTQLSPILISEDGEPVTARGGYTVVPNFGFHNHPSLDVLIVVGGVHVAEMDKPVVLNWIKAQAENASLTASVCTGAFILAAAGALTHQKVTTHWEDIPDLRNQFPQLTVEESVRWVDEGAIITSAGISAGIDMSLHIVSRLHSRELAEKTARQMDYDWQQR